MTAGAKRLRAFKASGAAVRMTAREAGLRLMFDASALTKRYVLELGREHVLGLFALAGEVVIAAHCQTEVASALLRRRRDGDLTPEEFDRAWAAAQRDIADMTHIPLDAHVERFAFAAMDYGPLRAMDALHVGSALSAGVDLFVTADRRQAHAAQGMGLKTELVTP